MMNSLNYQVLKTGWVSLRRGAGQAAAGHTTGIRQEPPTINGTTGEIDEASHAPSRPGWLQYVPAGVRDLVASHLPPGLLDVLGHDFVLPGGQPLRDGPAVDAANRPAGAQFLSRSFTNPAGSRPYKLYVPSRYAGRPVALVVMLHGCTQSPDDFAAGTGMNDAAEQQNFLVVYPGQTTSGHAQKCWKWFSPDDQRRGTGEPSLIAGITRQVMQEYAVDPRRVYVAGLSAGGAAAAIMAQTYPDLYAAIGVHSGLACGAASDLPSALAAMRGGAGAASTTPGSGATRPVPAIVFHGDRDSTVNARNGTHVAKQSVGNAATRTHVQTGETADGHAYSRTIYLDATGDALTEHWLIHGAGHAWSGGSTAGTYTDPRGPDATQELLRFFWEHPHPTPAS